MTVHASAYLLVDANVLIDYVASDSSILTLATRHLGQVYVLSTVIDEVDGLDEAECRRLGLGLREPDLAELSTAAQKRGSLSTEDHLCLIVARTEGWTCVTNDTALRRACGNGSIPVLWGLEVMTKLVRRAQLGAEEAVAVANSIHTSNPLHIPLALVERFSALVRSLESDQH